MDNACLDLLAGLRMTLVCKEDKVRGCICMYVVIGRLSSYHDNWKLVGDLHCILAVHIVLYDF